MRKMIIVGNWKMYKTANEAVELAKGINASKKVDVVIAPTFTSLSKVAEAIKGKAIALSAQNAHFEDEGAFTGEISPKMVKDIGCHYVILGHSERRHVFSESDEMINKKIISALKHGLKVIFCIGEKLDQRESNKTKEVLNVQLTKGLAGISNMDNVVIAYEPVWAIGTGKVATPEQAQEAHAHIRMKLSEMYSKQIADKVIILYGGSVKPENADSLLSLEDVDGVLVGGASLKAESFNQIIASGERNC